MTFPTNTPQQSRRPAQDPTSPASRTASEKASSKTAILMMLLVLSIVATLASGVAAGVTGIAPLAIITIISIGVASICLSQLLKKPPRIAPIPTRPVITAPKPPPPKGPRPISISSPPSKAQLDFINYRKLLSASWISKNSIDEISIRCSPAPGTSTSNIFELQNTKLVLIDTQGDITKPRYHSPMFTMLVNAANPEMMPGGGGTNAAFTKATSKTCWENSKKSEDPSRNGKPLEVGECRSAAWENPDGTSNRTRPGEPHYLAQLLGPRASEIQNDYQQAYRECKQGYMNCLLEAKRRGANLIQLPLISSGIYAPSYNLDGGKTLKLWIDAVKTALVEATQEFGSQEENRNTPYIIILTGIAGTQLD